jgi:hypothetical protein
MTTEAPGRPRSSDKMAALFEALELTDFQKRLVRDRLLDQIAWMSDKAKKDRARYFVIRAPIVVGGVAIPGLVSLVLFAHDTGQGDFRALLFIVSIVVGVAAAVEELFRYGDRWRHYRQTAERLKSIGWQFLMLNGLFSRHESHADAFKSFTSRVEEILGDDVEGYMSMVSQEGKSQHHVFH